MTTRCLFCGEPVQVLRLEVGGHLAAQAQGCSSCGAWSSVGDPSKRLLNLLMEFSPRPADRPLTWGDIATVDREERRRTRDASEEGI